MDRKLAMQIHAESGVGKSRLLDTAPGPRLIFDVEGGTDWTPSPKILWDPAFPLPTEFPDGSPLTADTTVVINVINFDTLRMGYQWLSTGNHYFESVCIDSGTKAQKRCKLAIGGDNQFSEQMWGQLLAKMESLMGDLVDLKKHPIKPVNIFIAAISGEKNNKQRAKYEGALSDSLPGFVDVNAYMYVAAATDGSGRMERHLLIQPQPTIDAKDRTDFLTQRFGLTIPTSVGNETICDLACIVDVINGRR